MTGAAHADANIRSCPQCRWDGSPRKCRWCNTDLKGRQQRWCGPCGVPGQGYFADHDWQAVRAAALRRDGYRCVTCLSSPDEVKAVLVAALAAFLPVPVEVTTGASGLRVHPLRDGRRWHVNTSSAVGHEGAVLVKFAMDRYNAARLEVNHKVPILGRHGQTGCHHHLDGVETLCRRCHLQETARQFGHRIAKPVEAPKVPQLFDVA